MTTTGTLDNINGGLECPADGYRWQNKVVQLKLNSYYRAGTAIGINRLSRHLDMDVRMRQ